MKTLAITFFIISTSLAGGNLSFSQSDSNDSQSLPALSCNAKKISARAIRNYTEGLRSKNNGVVESCLYYAVRMRVEHADMDLGILESEIDALVKKGRTHSIRHKAAIASTIFASPALITLNSAAGSESINDFFSALSGQVTAQLVVLK